MLSDFPVLFHLLLPVVGFLVGVFGSFTGFGGSFILVPTLSELFGLPYPAAITCTLAQMVAMSASGLRKHLSLGHVDGKLAGNFLIGSIPCAVIGRLFLHWLENAYGSMRESFRVLYVIIISVTVLALAVRLMHLLKHRRLREKGRSRPARLERRPARFLVVLLAGCAAGLLAGLLAIGGGIVAVPVLAGLLGAPITTAVGTSLFQMIFAAVAGTIPSIGTVDLNWVVTGLLIIGSIPGAALGPVLLRRVIARIDKYTYGNNA